ncbi:ABC transporter ATP-binding protein [Actinokineospora iranica]|uniref:ABC-type multidrug transport system, ATPase component n=1 Tax=Actinokineospora iranica TaxID=1271860 RepID=A0A1G6MG51_9PSEU|nr:ABC transporter ATP-binding protein [Actinokineospora iranica]SDC53966.1 ABC-type multidrug transport system, ATPase component [Actinokineospora iranica]
MNIVIDGLRKVYRGGKVALDGVDLTLGQGMTGLLGPNGAGKTTLMRILTGVLRPTEGRVVVDGHDMATTAGAAAVKRMLGYLPQELAPYPDLTAREFLDYIALLKGIDDMSARRAQVEELLAEVGLADHRDRRVGAFSGGMKRRLGIAQALLGTPRLIVVDEPTSGLDPQERMRFRALLAGLGGGRSTILSTHILDDVAQTCPQVCVLTGGRAVFHGTTAGLTAAAKGKTFLVRGDRPPADAVLVNAVSGPDGTEYRLVGTTAPAGAVSVSPTLEDGYVALLQSIEPTTTG